MKNYNANILLFFAKSRIRQLKKMLGVCNIKNPLQRNKLPVFFELDLFFDFAN